MQSANANHVVGGARGEIERKLYDATDPVAPDLVALRYEAKTG